MNNRLFSVVEVLNSVVFIFIMLLIPFEGIAQTDKSFLIGVEETDLYPIFSYDKSTLEYKGYSRELLDLFAIKQGYKFTYQVYPVKRLYMNLYWGNVDFKFPDNPLWQKEVKQSYKINYTQPIAFLNEVIMVLSANKGRGIENFKILGLVGGFTPEMFGDEINSGKIQIHEGFSIKALLTMLKYGRVDGVHIPDINVAKYHLEQMGVTNKIVPDYSLYKSNGGSYFMSSIKHPQIIIEFDKFLIEETHSIQKLKEKYNISW